MQWIEVSVPTRSDEIDDVCAQLAELGAGGMVVEDETDFQQFLEQNHQYWDYVDDALEAQFRGVSRIKFYLADDDDGRAQLAAILEQYDRHPEVQRMREFIQHGDVTTYQHCKNVVLVSWWLNHRLHLGADETSLAVGAFLHDFYLYDWHKKGTFHGIRRLFEMHGFSHPGCACVNAEKVFHITKKEQSIISSHMWPLTFRHVPSCREAIIVCLADKYCAVVESMFKRSRVAAAKNANGEYDEW